MRKHFLSSRRRTSYSPNLTPLIDTIFTLSMFFMLVSSAASVERVPLQLPAPTESQARSIKVPDRVVINCRLAEAGSPGAEQVLYSLGPTQPEPLESLSARLWSLKQQYPGLQVVIRADRRVRYADVHAVMQIVVEHGLNALNVAAVLREGS